MPIVQISSETIPEFIRRAGQGQNMSTGNIANRFSKHPRDMYVELLVGGAR
jgi:hypothetical protein